MRGKIFNEPILESVSWIKATYPDDVWVLFEPLAAGRHVHDLAPDAGLGVLADGGLAPPARGQRGAQVIRLRGVVTLVLASVTCSRSDSECRRNTFNRD